MLAGLLRCFLRLLLERASEFAGLLRFST